MPRPLLLLLTCALAAACAATTARAAGAQRWHRPVEGGVVGAFRFDREAPYAAGRRRGLDLRAPRGAPVRAPCAGVVIFAGRTPRGRAVTVRCGGLLATHVGLAAVAVSRGQLLARGTRLGAAAGPVLRLGARRAGDPQGYVDPARLLAGARGAPASPPAVAPRGPRRTPPQATPPRVGPPFARAAPRAAPVAVPAAAPLAAPATPLLALALAGAVVLAASSGTTIARRRRRRRVPGRTGAPAVVRR